jgi:hypothetical protein
MSDLIEHLEQYLGDIVVGYGKDEDGKKLPFQIVRFENAPPNTVTLVTLGFSAARLGIGAAGRRVRQEYLMTMNAGWDSRNIPAVIHQVAMEAYEKDTGYVRGQVIGPRGTLVSGTAIEALYVTLPVYFPDGFHVYQPEEGEPIVLAWLVPITAAEARYAGEKGWEAFEDLLAEVDPDLRDLGRVSIV